MPKLGYTFYPKDWQTDDLVFELDLEQRAVFRELIDRAMTTDNKIEYRPSTWARKLNTTAEKIEAICKALCEATLISLSTDYKVFVPSCEKRLKLVRAGRKGGRSKPSGKPFDKPLDKQEESESEREIEREKENSESSPFLDQLQKLRNADLSKLGKNGFRAKAFQHFESVRGSYAWIDQNEIKVIDSIEQALKNRIKGKDKNFKPNADDCMVLFKKSLQAFEQDSFYQGKSISTFKNKIDEFLNKAKTSNRNGR